MDHPSQGSVKSLVVDFPSALKLSEINGCVEGGESLLKNL